MSFTANSNQRDYRAHSADCEAQLVRLRAEVTRISQSYEQLKERRYHQRLNKSTLKETELKQELERLKLKLQTAVKRVALLEAGLLQGSNFEPSRENKTVLMEATMAENKIGKIDMQPVQSQLEELFDQHCSQLNHEILKIFSN